MIRSVFFLAAFLIYTSSFAQSFQSMKDSKSFQQKLHSIAAKTTSLQSDFVQIKHLDVLSEDIESNGKLVYKANNKLRWEYTTPLEYLIILNGGKVSIKDEGKVSSYDLSGNKTFQKINEMMIGSIQGDLLVNEADYKYEFKENSSNYLVVMYPKEKKVQEFMKSINIYFSKKDYSVEQVKMLEQSGDYTLMKFKNKKINASISDKTFIIN
ncbi:MAG: Outer membrane lipoprotein carrier protein LolA [uncultured Aureispira sp.]|uniref:Outer membrane lipoprotein carrier protein LolA n=1 Tax=uncultured Aureispira sp. TaxID=1331704 RepID=A0A6S6TV08_9BACT|nr:MAG: Outer membrane lipoprotein carrier protein LolA [uncultured Aureispira sp.]